MPSNESVNPMQTVNIVTGIIRMMIRAWATTIEPFVRTRFGAKHFGMNAGVGWVMMLLYSVFTTPPWEMLPFNILCYLIPFMWAVRSCQAYRRDRKGDFEHSYYTGEPFLCRWFGMDETRTKYFWEPLCVVAVGICIGIVHPTFGFYVAFGGLCMALDYSGVQHDREMMLRNTRDTMFLQQQVASDMRSFRR